MLGSLVASVMLCLLYQHGRHDVLTSGDGHGVCGTIVSSVCDGVDIQVVGHVALEADFDKSGVCESFNVCVAHVVADAVASFQMLTAAPNSGICHDLDLCVVEHVVAALVNNDDCNMWATTVAAIS